MAKFITLDNLSRFKDKCDENYMSKESIDDTPTENSENLVTSGGIKTYVDDTTKALEDSLDDKYMSKELIDDTPTDDSENLVKSGGVKSYVDEAILNAITQTLGGSY